MTLVSLQELAKFINKYSPHGRISDYGGTDKIGAQIVSRMLSLNNVSVERAIPAPGDEISPIGVNVFVNGSLNDNIFKYITLDYDSGIDLMKPILGKKFDFGISMDLLEHTSSPFIVAENIRNSLKKGAFLFVTVPMHWELHEVPQDFWRFMPDGLLEVFKKMKKISIDVIRDQSDEEDLPRTRIVAVFKKI